MAVRLKEGMIPYTGGDGIEITDNHVINVLLRAANNLIQVNDDREIYVDLQLPAGIAPDDVFPVGITTGEILAEDGWQQSGTIINSKTTSGDYVRIIYANDGNLYYDPGTGQWIMIGTATAIDVNTKTFFIYNENSQETDLTLLAVADYYRSGKNPLICYKNQIYTLQRVFDDLTEDAFIDFTFINTPFIGTAPNGKRDEQPETLQPLYIRWINFRVSQGEIENPQFSSVDLDDYLVQTSGNKAQTITGTKTFTTSPVVPSKSTPAGNNPTAIATEAQVYLKQDKLTAGSGISIDSNTNTISANIQGALVYKGNVATTSDLPASGTVGDVYYVEADGLMYARDGTAWKAVGNTQIDLSNYFNMTTNTTDDITEGSTNLFVTQAMIDAWNGKQGALTAGTNITINNGVISATDTTYSAGTGIGITGTTISNTLPFAPENQGAVGQVLKRTSTGVRWGSGIDVDGTSLGKYLKACTEYGSAHNIAIGVDTTYTFQGIGYILIDRMRGYTLEINGVIIFSYPFNSGTYNEYKYLGPYTMSARDTVRLWREGSSGTINCRVVDYYPENTPLLNFTANTANSTIQLTKIGNPYDIQLEKSTDGTNWTDYTIGDTITLAIEGERVYLRNKSAVNTSFSKDENNYYKFVMSGSVAANGDLNYLVSKYSNKLTNNYHYINLFYGCTALTKAPELPSTTVSNSCYKNMFNGCTSLTTAPTILPATSTAHLCYQSMFYGCTSLVTVPTLPATSIDYGSYDNMFAYCSALTTVPALPATSVASTSYNRMFYYCTSLTSLPVLPATDLITACYYQMFQGCSNIKVSEIQTGEYQTPYRIPSAGTVGTYGNNCVKEMFIYTGGTFTGTPVTETTYYTSNNIIS